MHNILILSFCLFQLALSSHKASQCYGHCVQMYSTFCTDFLHFVLQPLPFLWYVLMGYDLFFPFSDIL